MALSTAVAVSTALTVMLETMEVVEVEADEAAAEVLITDETGLLELTTTEVAEVVTAAMELSVTVVVTEVGAWICPSEIWETIWAYATAKEPRRIAVVRIFAEG